MQGMSLFYRYILLTGWLLLPVRVDAESAHF